MRKSFKEAIIYALFLVLITLLIGEAGVRMAYPLVRNYDLEMWRYAAYGKISGNCPGMSHRHKPGVYFKDLYAAEVKINSKGLRDYEYGYQKPEHCYRILALGDSITFGWGVGFEQTYVKTLERSLNSSRGDIKYQVLDCGVGNYQIRDEVAFLKCEGLKYNPDMVILGYFVDDAKINGKVNFFDLKKHSYFYALLASKFNTLKASLNPNYNFLNYYSAFYTPGSATMANLDENIEELKDICRLRKIPLIVMLIPELHNLKNYPFNNVRQYIAAKFSGQDNVSVLDLLSYFDNNQDPVVYWVSPEDAHHNAKAQAIMAEALLPQVLRLKNSKKN